MNRIFAAVCGILLACAAGPALAASNPWGDWQGNWQFEDPNTAQERLNAATQQYLFQHPGVGQPSVTSIGTENNTYNGPVSSPSSGATNIINLNDVSAKAVDGGTVTVSTQQSSRTADQSATSTIDISK